MSDTKAKMKADLDALQGALTAGYMDGLMYAWIERREDGTPLPHVNVISGGEPSREQVERLVTHLRGIGDVLREIAQGERKL